jgi:hypothetical protein
LTGLGALRILRGTMTSIPRVLSLGVIILALPGLPGASAA